MTNPKHAELMALAKAAMEAYAGQSPEESAKAEAALASAIAEVVQEADASDEVIELAGALEVRRILESIKEVAAIHPADEVPTPFQAAFASACEEIFYRATGCQWHMDEDAERFSRSAAQKTAGV